MIDWPGHCHTAADQEELKPPWESSVPRAVIGARPESGEPCRGRGLLPALLRWEARDGVGVRQSTISSAGPSARTKEDFHRDF